MEYTITIQETKTGKKVSGLVITEIEEMFKGLNMVVEVKPGKYEIT